MARRNIQYQLTYSVYNNFKESMDKHAAKNQEEKDAAKIYSYEYRRNLIKYSNSLGKYMKVNFPEVKYAVDINSEHIQSFLNAHIYSCTQDTLNGYMSYSNKVCNLINKTYNSSNKYILEKPISQSSYQSVKDKMIPREIYNELHKHLNRNGQVAIELSSHFGLRVSDVTKLQKRDIRLEQKEIFIKNSKGGRDRRIPIETSKQWNIAVSIKENTQGNHFQRVVPIQSESIQKEIDRKMKKMGIDKEYKTVKLHGFRKLYAQETYDRFRDVGDNDKKALGKVSERLGHSFKRGEDKELQRTYVKNRRK